MIDIIFSVPIVPEGAQRAKSRALMGKGGKPVMKNGRPVVVTNKVTKTLAWQSKLAEAAERHMPDALIDEPVRVDVLALFPRPKRLMRKCDPEGPVWHDKKPDRDNLDKNVLDGLKAFWRDDTLVCLGTLLKAYHAKDGRPAVVVRIRSASLFSPQTVAQQLGLLPPAPAAALPASQDALPVCDDDDSWQDLEAS